MATIGFSQCSLSTEAYLLPSCRLIDSDTSCASREVSSHFRRQQRAKKIFNFFKHGHATSLDRMHICKRSVATSAFIRRFAVSNDETETVDKISYR